VNVAPVGESAHSSPHISLKALLKKVKAIPRWKKLTAVTMVFLLLFLSFPAIQDYAGSLVENAEVSIQGIRIISSDNDSLNVEIEAIITNPAPVSAHIDDSDLHIIYEGKIAADFTLPATKLNSGDNDETLKMTIEEHDRFALQSFADDLLSSRVHEVLVTGILKIKGWFPMDVQISKTIEMEEFQNPEVEIQAISIINSTEEGIRGTVVAAVQNPSKLETTLDGLTFDVFLNDSALATINGNGFLRRGGSEVNVSVFIPDHSVDVGQSVLSGMMNGENLSFSIRGNGSSDSLLSRLSAGIRYEYSDNSSSVGNFSDLNMEVLDITITETRDEGIFGVVNALVTNPSIIETTLDGLAFELSINGSQLAILSASGFMDQGESFLRMSMFVPAEASDAYNLLATEIINGENHTFNIQGMDISGLPLSRLSTEFSYTYVMNTSGSVDAEVTSMDVSPGLFTTHIDITASLNNPTPIRMDISLFDLSAYYQGNYLSGINVSDPWIVPGNQSIDLDMSISTISLQNLGLLFKLLSGSDIDILIEGKHVFDETNVLRFYLTATI